MKTILALIFLSTSIVFAADSDPYSTFKANLEVAISKKDLNLLNQLFYTKGASEYQIDMVVYPYEYNWENYVFDKIEFKSSDDPSYSEAAIQAMLKGQIMNGHTYIPNITPTKFCSVKFKSRDGKSSTGTVSPIGITPDGSVKFVLVEKTTAEQDSTANP